MTISKKGVTLIELLIVVGIISIVAAVGGDILLTVVRAYKKAQTLGVVEQNGSLVGTLLENDLRNSSVIKYENDIGEFVDVSEGQTVYSDGIKITSSQGVTTAIRFVEGVDSEDDCSNGKFLVDDVSITTTNATLGVNVLKKGGSSIFTIYNPTSGPPIVTVLFDVTEGCQSPVTAKAEFNTTVTLRGDYGN